MHHTPQKTSLQPRQGSAWRPTRMAAAAVLAWSSISGAHAATNASAQVALSNVKVSISALDAQPSVTGLWPWIGQNTGPGWPATAESTVVAADIVDAAVHQGSSGWLGAGRTATATASNASAHAGVSFAGANLFSPGAAWSFATAADGESAFSVARLWDAAFMVGAKTEVVVSLTLDTLSAFGHGGTATALASLAIWSGNIDAGLVSAQAQVIDSPDYTLAYTGPTTLSVTWRNDSTATAVAQISLLTSTQVLSAVASPVPEPASGLMLLAGLFGVAVLLGRRRSQAARSTLAN